MTERKLASIRRIAEIIPIPHADKIVVAKIDGWQVITQKTNFQSGDLCIFFEVDSFLPVREEFEFLRDKCFKSTKNLGDGFRLKTMKMRGELSQGLALPFELFHELYYHGQSEYDSVECLFQEGHDVTELLKVQKYEKPIPVHLQGKIKGNFPGFLRKTDQERVQNSKRDLLEYWEDSFEVTTKLDGSSMTAYIYDDYYGCCSRNVDLKFDLLEETQDNTFVQTAIKYDLFGACDELFERNGFHYALQGELMGPGVQGNREKLNEHHFYLFDIWNIDTQQHVLPRERMEYVIYLQSKGFNIEHVPIIEPSIKLQEWLPEGDAIPSILQKASEYKSINHPISEGLVFKSLNNSFSFKAINNNYLLKEKD